MPPPAPRPVTCEWSEVLAGLWKFGRDGLPLPMAARCLRDAMSLGYVCFGLVLGGGCCSKRTSRPTSMCSVGHAGHSHGLMGENLKKQSKMTSKQALRVAGVLPCSVRA